MSCNCVVFMPFRLIWSLIEAFMNWIVPENRKKINGKVAVISGSGQGIGRELAYRFVKEGVKIALLDIDENSNKATEDEIKDLGGECKAYKCDVTKRDEISKVAEEIRRDLGEVTILVNNAGIMNVSSIMDVPHDDVQKAVELNVLGVLWMVKEFLPYMVKVNDGHIVNMSSICGRVGFALNVDYCTTKFAVHGLSAALTAELDRLNKPNVFVSTAYPTAVDTNLYRKVLDRMEFHSKLKPLSPEVVADTIVDGVLRNKTKIFVPSSLSITASLFNHLPSKTMKILLGSRKVGFYEKPKQN